MKTERKGGRHKKKFLKCTALWCLLTALDKMGPYPSYYLYIVGVNKYLLEEATNTEYTVDLTPRGSDRKPNENLLK